MSARPEPPTTRAVIPAESMDEAIASTRLEGLGLPPEVNAAHPFREGNGRTQRAFYRQLARDAGWNLGGRR